MYCIPYKKDLAEAICEQGERFMIKHVQADTPPTDSLPSLEVLKRIRRQPNKTIEIPARVAVEYQMANATRLVAEKVEEKAKAALVAALGDAEAGNYGVGVATYMLQKRKGYTVAETEFRTLKIKANK